MPHGLCQSGVSKKWHVLRPESGLFLKDFRGAGKPAMQADELSAMDLTQNVNDLRGNGPSRCISMAAETGKHLSARIRIYAFDRQGSVVDRHKGPATRNCFRPQ
jgi:hypothetical protein